MFPICRKLYLRPVGSSVQSQSWPLSLASMEPLTCGLWRRGHLQAQASCRMGSGLQWSPQTLSWKHATTIKSITRWPRPVSRAEGWGHVLINASIYHGCIVSFSNEGQTWSFSKRFANAKCEYVYFCYYLILGYSVYIFTCSYIDSPIVANHKDWFIYRHSSSSQSQKLIHISLVL